MSNLFNAPEIIDMGIEKEKKRRDFYGMVAEKMQDGDTKKLFNDLRDWEGTHIEKFSEIRKGINKMEATDSYPGELTEYMKTLIDEQLYSEVSPDEFSKNVKSPRDAVKYGISFEKDAILFFREMMPFMTPAHNEAVQKLIDEEKKHLIYLTDLKKKLN